MSYECTSNFQFPYNTAGFNAPFPLRLVYIIIVPALQGGTFCTYNQALGGDPQVGHPQELQGPELIVATFRLSHLLWLTSVFTNMSCNLVQYCISPLEQVARAVVVS